MPDMIANDAGMGTVMQARPIRLAVVLAVVVGVPGPTFSEDPTPSSPSPSPEAWAVRYLVREVPRWSRENGCFSCHNNGDAARALYAASRGTEPVPPEALAETTRWLDEPERWEHNGGDGAFSDKRLARLQFTSALASAVAAGQVTGRRGLIRAAERVASDQDDDGAFLLEGGALLGSPTTYGRALATRVLRDTLRAADPARFRVAIDKAERWLVAAPVESLLDASAILPVVSGPGSATIPGADDRRRRCLDLIRRGQSTDGGWGAYDTSPPEPFDTAVVLLALVRFVEDEEGAQAKGTSGLRPLIDRGRGFLVATQNQDGSWPETTRPAGAESYAQRLSTTGWATLALLATRGNGR